MTYYENEAGARALRVMIAAYGMAQTRNYRSSLLEFSGLTEQELTEWAKSGRVSDRWLRTGFHGYELQRENGHVALWNRDRGQTIVFVPQEGWRAAMTTRVREFLPGHADRIQAYIETQVPAW